MIKLGRNPDYIIGGDIPIMWSCWIDRGRKKSILPNKVWTCTTKNKVHIKSMAKVETLMRLGIESCICLATMHCPNTKMAYYDLAKGVMSMPDEDIQNLMRQGHII